MTDMRHGGGGDLTQAYKFAKKDMSNDAEGEQPFPDSWIATTGPVALGCLTDIASEVMLTHGSDGATLLWPIVGRSFRRWCNGDFRKDEYGRYVPGTWAPCEALVRIATGEILRFSNRLVARLPHMPRGDAELWCATFVCYFNDTLMESLDIEDGVQNDLLDRKLRAYESRQEVSIDEHSSVPAAGASPTISPENGSPLGWVKLVPVLKIRCIAAYFLQQAVQSLKEDAFLFYLTEENASKTLTTLDRSRRMADLAVQSEDLTHAFQEAMLSEWGDDDGQMGEDALVSIARLSQTQGSAMFYLTQTAGATQGAIVLLSALFEFKIEAESNAEVEMPLWDRERFAAPYLLETFKDVLTKFIESEAKEGKRIDPNVWRSAAESGVKVAVYCTSFASVVIDLLTAMLAFDDHHMTLHGPAFFPMICRLIQVQSDEIRLQVQRILIEKFGPMIEASSRAEC